MTASAAGPIALSAKRAGTWKVAVAIAAVFVIAAAVAALSLRTPVDPPDTPPVIAGLGGDFELAGAAGTRVRLQDFRGRVVLLFFGYTHCPDVCPTTLLALKQAQDGLGPSADQPQVLMVSVDPRRDPPDQLADYVHFFDPRFVGLSGTPEEIDKVARQYRVFYRPGGTGGRDSVAHSGYIYALDRAGRVRALLGAEAKPAQIGETVRQLLRESTNRAS